jgi:uroporphyrin-III C-methyltransferase
MAAGQTQVYLVGAGPGDPDLLTVKAYRLLTDARVRNRVVLYDRLVGPAVLDLIPAGVSRIFVGKSAGNHCVPQTEINGLLYKLVATGHSVVRLKGGDPFVFGRGGEEAEFLAEQGVRFEVVPGITAAVACAAYAGIPLTHRALASGVYLLAGHRCDGRSVEADWGALADPCVTLVVYMGLANLAHIEAKLRQAGRPGDTPAAIVVWGTTEQQRTVFTPLDGLAKRAAESDVCPPAIVVIGQTVSLAHLLSWFDPSALSVPQSEGARCCA